MTIKEILYADHIANTVAAILDRNVVSHERNHGVVFGSLLRESVPLTVHTVIFDGPPVPRMEDASKWCLWAEGNELRYTS